MGGNKGPKGRTSGKLGGQMRTFPPPSSPQTAASQPDRPLTPMADLEALGNDLKLHFDTLLEKKLDQKFDSKLAPISKELRSFKEAIGEVAKTANEAFNIATTLEGRTSTLETSERQLKERIAWLESRARALNLKVRGIPELHDLNSDLIPALTDWCDGGRCSHTGGCL